MLLIRCSDSRRMAISRGLSFMMTGCHASSQRKELAAVEMPHAVPRPGLSGPPVSQNWGQSNRSNCLSNKKRTVLR